MKIIFLDFDGVLAVCHKTRDQFGSLFHPEFVDNLSWIINETKAKVVISSTWRMSGFEEMKQLWEFRKMPGELIGITGRDASGVRGIEIQNILDDMKFQRINYSKREQSNYLEISKCKNYVILDDDSDMLYNQREHYVCCSHPIGKGIERYGLTREVAAEAIRILNTDLIDLYYPKNKNV
jgi:hypothetical protein